MRKLMEELIAELVRNEIPLDLAKRELERIYLEHVLAAYNGNQSAAARKLGIHRNTLSKKLEPLLDAMRYPGSNC
jgi:DNA-binding protein Fis